MFRRGILGHVAPSTSPADDPAAALLTAIVHLSHRDMARIGRLGDLASPAEKRDLAEAEIFLAWCREEFAQRLRG